MKNTYRGRDGKLRFKDSNIPVHKWIARKEAIKASKRRSNSTYAEEKPVIILHVLLVVVSIASLIGLNQSSISKIISFFCGLIISAYYSLVADKIAEGSGLKFLEKYKFTLTVGKLKFSKSAFWVAVILIEWLLLK